MRRSGNGTWLLHRSPSKNRSPNTLGESAAKEHLEREHARLEESLFIARIRIDYLESDEYGSSLVEKRRKAIVSEFRQSAMAKFEVALAYKAGCDYTASQLPIEYQEAPRQPQYPPVISDSIDLLSQLEKAGAGYNVMGGGEEEEEETAGSSADGSGEESEGDVDGGQVGRTSKEEEHKAPSNPAPSMSISRPPTSGADMDLP